MICLQKQPLQIIQKSGNKIVKRTIHTIVKNMGIALWMNQDWIVVKKQSKWHLEVTMREVTGEKCYNMRRIGGREGRKLTIAFKAPKKHLKYRKYLEQAKITKPE